MSALPSRAGSSQRVHDKPGAVQIIENGPRQIVKEFKRLEVFVHGPYLASRQDEGERSLLEEDAAGLVLEEAEPPDEIGPSLSCKLKRVRDAALKKLKDINRPRGGV